MDQNMDSPGSCPLDVNGDASKILDTENSSAPIAQNCSLHVPERCSLKLNSNQKISVVNDSGNSICELKAISQPSPIGSELSEVDLFISSGKKPSYLNLACCVNGYSSITTYNSKIRKDINKSRDVSPIRPSINSFQYCKKSNNLTPPLQLVMSNLNPSTSPLSQTSSIETKNNCIRNGNEDFYNSSEDKVRNSEDKKGSTSFIQQRLERLYGPGALAQGFYSPKKIKANIEDHFVDITSAEFNNKLKMLSLSGDYRAFNRKSIDGTESAEKPKHLSNEKCENNINDLPVLRLLSQEFRAQLPSISSKRSYVRKTEKQCSDYIFSKEKLPVSQLSLVKDEVDYEAGMKSEETEFSKGVISMEPPLSMSNFIEKDRDGSYYLRILRNEQSRLLALADRAEKYIEQLSNNIEVSEDIFGVLRSACGQARLLVSQKMKQFEGLCYKNLSVSLDDKFPTTVEDLQGFWDMLYLQVSSINETFEEIELLKKNDWKKTNLDISPAKGTKQILLKQKKTKPTTFANIDGDISKTASRTTATLMKREAQRKQLLELKRKHKMALAVNSNILPADGSNPITNESDLFVKENSS